LKDYFIRRGAEKIHLNFFFCSEWQGVVKSMERQEIKWVTLSEMTQHKMLTSNKKIINHLFCLF